MDIFYGDNYFYDLYAMVCHDGDHYQSGHYTTYCRDEANWYKYDDANVTEVQMSDNSMHYEECISNCYLLFYVRQLNSINVQPDDKKLCLDVNNNIQSFNIHNDIQCIYNLMSNIKIDFIELMNKNDKIKLKKECVNMDSSEEDDEIQLKSEIEFENMDTQRVTYNYFRTKIEMWIVKLECFKRFNKNQLLVSLKLFKSSINKR
jgi:hypothetical protein